MYWVTEKKNPKYPTPNFRALTRLVVLYSQNYTTGIRGHYHTYKNTRHIFYPQKSGNRKFQTPKNPSIIPVTWDTEYM